jgi:hypothetical protein
MLSTSTPIPQENPPIRQHDPSSDRSDCRARREQAERERRDEAARERGRIRSIEAKNVEAVDIPADDFGAWLLAKLAAPMACKEASR